MRSLSQNKKLCYWEYRVGIQYISATPCTDEKVATPQIVGMGDKVEKNVSPIVRFRGMRSIEVLIH